MWTKLFLKADEEGDVLSAEMVESARALPPEQRAALLFPLKVVRMSYEPLRAGPMQGGAGLFRSIPPMRFRPNLRDVRDRAPATLSLLREIGDERDLELVGFLAQIEPRTPIAREIQQAATICLPYVEQRAQRNREARTLLRSPAAVVPVHPPSCFALSQLTIHIEGKPS